MGLPSITVQAVCANACVLKTSIATGPLLPLGRASDTAAHTSFVSLCYVLWSAASHLAKVFKQTRARNDQDTQGRAQQAQDFPPRGTESRVCQNLGFQLFKLPFIDAASISQGLQIYKGGNFINASSRSLLNWRWPLCLLRCCWKRAA